MVDVNYTVSANNDDAHENYLNRGITNGNVVTVYDGGDWSGSDGFFRFQNVLVPQAATINSATLSPYVNAVANDDLVCTIYGNDVDDANDIAGEADVDGRTRTTASTAENHAALGAGFHDADVKAIVQEIVDRVGWASGNNMAFMYIALHVAAANHCDFNGFELGANPAKLAISYTAAGGVSKKRMLMGVGLMAKTPKFQPRKVCPFKCPLPLFK